MTGWATIASLSTAGGTLVLAVATFASVRSANRAERSLQLSLRPVLMPLRADDPAEKVLFADGRTLVVRGGMAVVEEADGQSYLEGGQHTISRFGLTPREASEWFCSVVRHWSIDGHDPR